MNLSFRHRIGFLIAILTVAIAVVFVLPPIPQDPNYHLFSDTRGFFGIPNFGDVASNLGFAIVGVLALVALMARRSDVFDHPRDARPYLVFFVGVALVSLGSAYYHWEPSNDRLLWDRLPMSIAFMAISAGVVADRIDAKAGNGWLLGLLIALGLGSLIYWDWTESLGRGDLRAYGLVQFYPMIAFPFIVWLFREHRYTAGRYLLWVIAWYGLSKVLEFFDRGVFDLTAQSVSGHTLKHLAAAVATYVMLRMLLSRASGVGAASSRDTKDLAI